MKDQVKKLWRLCFNDSEEFTELYFRLRYTDDINAAIWSGDELIAALQMIPYPLTFCGQTVRTAYISGACTHPDFRNRGVMGELLAESFARMHRNRVSFATLIPAEPWLFGYYARTGFAPVFGLCRQTFVPTSCPALPPDTCVETADGFSEEASTYLYRKQQERPCCVLHTADDLKVVEADLQLSGGKVFALKADGRTAALAVAYPEAGERWTVGEVVADSPQAQADLLDSLCHTVQASELTLLLPPSEGDGSEVRPLGMARIVDVRDVLHLYAAAHPEAELNLEVTDEQLAANNGYYYLNNGKCMESDRRLPGRHLSLSIGELTQLLLEPARPYMSLMLN
mgnify:CR=1 FL=1